jgi:hypothetical protein
VNNWSKYTFTVLIICALFAQHTGKLLLIADYYTNTAGYLALCENKSRPSLHCNGQCILMKKLQKADKKEAQSPEKKIEWKYEVISRKTFYSRVSSTGISLLRKYFIPRSTGMPIGYPQTFFHPPAEV